MDRTLQLPEPPLDPSEREVYAHLVAAFLAFRRWRRGGVSEIDVLERSHREREETAA